MEKNYQIKQTNRELVIAGITIRTTNANNQCIEDINKFWEKFYYENVPSRISDISNRETVYGLYSNYESDLNGAYDFTIGYEVSSVDNIPSDMTIIRIPKAEFAVFEVTEELKLHDKLFKLWTNIWNSDVDRAYAVDFEAFEEKSACSDNPKVEIYISKK